MFAANFTANVQPNSGSTEDNQGGGFLAAARPRQIRSWGLERFRRGGHL